MMLVLVQQNKKSEPMKRLALGSSLFMRDCKIMHEHVHVCVNISDFRALRRSFFRHKGLHLIKSALIVAPHGYILDNHGLYFSDAQNNDAAMLQNEWNSDEDLNNWFQKGDIFVVDRGYRDIISVLKNFGLVRKMSLLLEAGEYQLTTEDANEALNGHLKSKFKYLGLFNRFTFFEILSGRNKYI
ncbi:hypothetical protein TSAR_011926 [Trichomalopsis sarcophagae]|uniref:DDE Tnp4 domain-containing protein n=1 Tax=Trichomalopsis sarcophagae TaxID=543379 RepID=A0A232EMR1_9HYME|nr:hypothetical protein TSAR_011926 [Trichomalopsis sarcophagae]